MYAGRDFDPSNTVESEVYGFDFVNDLADGEIVVGATWYCSVAPDSLVSDATPSIRLAGSSWLNTNTKTSQLVTGLQPNVKYILQAVATTSAGNILSIYSHVTCEAVS